MSERTRRRWISRLLKWKLWELVDAGGGRGKHPVYRIKGKAEFLKKQAHAEATENERKQASKKPGHEAKDKELKTAVKDNLVSADQKSAWKNDPARRREYFFSGWETLGKHGYGWNRCAQAFRIPLEELGLSKSVANSVTGLILSRLTGSSCALCKEVYTRFGEYVWKSRDRLAKLLQKGLAKLCAWVGWIVSRLVKGEKLDVAKSKKEKLWAINRKLRAHRHGTQCECVDCERERVEHQRKEYGKYQSNRVLRSQRVSIGEEDLQLSEQIQREAQEQWLAEVRAKPLTEKLVHLQEGLEAYRIALESLHSRRPTDSEWRARLESLCETFAISSEELANLEESFFQRFADMLSSAICPSRCPDLVPS